LREGFVVNETAHRVLVVEDEGLVALLIEDMLVDLGVEVAAVTGKLDEAIRLVAKEKLDVVILDVNLEGERSFPLLGSYAVPRCPSYSRQAMDRLASATSGSACRCLENHFDFMICVEY
jgi:CheY-like chemotaxis protein